MSRWDEPVDWDGLNGGLSPIQAAALIEAAEREAAGHEAVKRERRRARSRERYRKGSRTASQVTGLVAVLAYSVMTGQTPLAYLYAELPKLARQTEGVAVQALLDQGYSLAELARDLGITTKALRDRHPGLKSMRPRGGQWSEHR